MGGQAGGKPQDLIAALVYLHSNTSKAGKQDAARNPNAFRWEDLMPTASEIINDSPGGWHRDVVVDLKALSWMGFCTANTPSVCGAAQLPGSSITNA